MAAVTSYSKSGGIKLGLVPDVGRPVRVLACDHPPRVFRTPWSASQAWSFVEALAASPFLGILIATERHADVVSEVIKELPHLSGNLMHDLQTAALMREQGIRRIYTRDTGFHRFPFLEPIDPVT